ncbi:MAG: alpha/beta hydrolase [Alcanivorax borkumensis]|jgi:pimeloyl-ACP methyl ester carboxylesterase|uniref:Hydrolase, alpha/beta fold protein family, putative n=1 Tax=Alcanivorax borkumensis (strain ATCC 700651 / DSM 11573 / NCIMB 13689 / SK2) TaxID=393595 RepID=Q0VPS0_ALCBS|nr:MULTISPECIES: alpha/beta hydrolase [Alcanivorax]OJH08908.1 MAG: alpha/beta hydrolase [Alcanivorax borkumensis]CAL16828.1 hydrolase, alpha/beta fold protein family, putative [Alcanivorax borkumensis SK2]
MIDNQIATSVGPLNVKIWPVEGDRAPVVLLHDSLGCVALWREFPAALAQACGRTVIAYDRVGFGASPKREGSLPLSFVEDEAVVIDSLMSALALPQVVLLGHSVGGGMAVAAAASLGQRCVAVITESAQAMVEAQTLAGIRDAQVAFEDATQRARLQKYHGEKADWVLHAWIDTWLSPAFAEWNLDAELERVTCPLLCLHGDNDEFGSMAHPARLERMSAGPAEVVMLERCGHVPHREQEQGVLEAVSAFLSALP